MPYQIKVKACLAGCGLVLGLRINLLALYIGDDLYSNPRPRHARVCGTNDR